MGRAAAMSKGPVCRRQSSSACQPNLKPSPRIFLPLAAFKSYRQRVLLGAPFGQFTAVVGPNGCGKSVVVSFAGCLKHCMGACAQCTGGKFKSNFVLTCPGSAFQHMAEALELLCRARQSPLRWAATPA